MVREIEMKAWLRRPDEALPRIRTLCAPLGEHVKEDIYFRPPGGGRNIRLRRQDGRWVCTRKTRNLRDGLEVNDETEFEVSDGTAMAELLEDLGCRVYLRKTKTGSAFRRGDLTVEVSRVPPLGSFVEVECLLSEPRPGDEAAAEEKIRGFLADIGVREGEIEPRSYTQMLLQAGEAR